MAKAVGPFMSLDASGTIYGALTASIWKGRNYIRAYRVPTNPSSVAQVAHRLLFSNAVSGWQALNAAAKTLWNDFGTTCIPTLSGFNCYIKAHIALEGEPTIPEAPYIGKKGIHG